MSRPALLVSAFSLSENWVNGRIRTDDAIHHKDVVLASHAHPPQTPANEGKN